MARTTVQSTVRGRIREFLNGASWPGPVLEVGSLQIDDTSLRDLYNQRAEWLGIDLVEGPGVDMLCDITKCDDSLPYDYFGTVICSEVLEHIFDVSSALKQMYRVTRPGGKILVTTLFAFPEHQYPSDYWRFSESCLRQLLEDAGYQQVATQYAGEIVVSLVDRPGVRAVRKKMPIHVFAEGVKL